MFKTFEAWHGDYCIYNGGSIRAMYTKLYDYIAYSNHIDDSILDKYDNLTDIPKSEFEKIGIEIHISE